MMVGPPLAPVTSIGACRRRRARSSATSTTASACRARSRSPRPGRARTCSASPGFAAKSSISLLRRKPAPVTVTAEPYQPLIVVVSATALPRRSTTEKCVVWRPSARRGTAEISRDGVAWSGSIVARSAARERRREQLRPAILTNSGSPSISLRAANARRIASAMQVHGVGAVPAQVARGRSPRGCCAIIASATPPDDGGGIEITSCPRYVNSIGVAPLRLVAPRDPRAVMMPARASSRRR